MTWPSPLEWLGIIGTLATLTSLVLAWGARDTKKIIERMDTANRLQHGQTQAMLDPWTAAPKRSWSAWTARPRPATAT